MAEFLPRLMRQLSAFETNVRQEEEEEDEKKYTENSKLLHIDRQLSRPYWLSATRRAMIKGLVTSLLVFWTFVEGLGLARQAMMGVGPPVLVVVYSAPTNWNKRMALRDTWCSPASLLPSRSSCLFLLGSTGSNTKVAALLQQERDFFSDMVLNESFVDAYQNLSRKALVLLELAETLRGQGQLCVVKGDDDNYRQSAATPPALTGRIFVGRHNLVHRTGKHAFTTDEFPLAHFEPYPVGPLVMLPINATYKLLLASHHMRLLRGADDVLLAYLAYSANVAVRAEQQLLALHVCSSCWLRRGSFVAATNLAPSQIYRFHQEITDSRYRPCLPRHTLGWLSNKAISIVTNWYLAYHAFVPADFLYSDLGVPNSV
eukprot:g21399.t1